MGTIKEFQGNNRFLSNFYPAPVKYEGKIYPTSEHAYQAAKCLLPKDKDRIAKAFSAGEAKRLGKFVSRIPDWDAKKLSIMKDIVTCKFRQNPLLARTLLATGDTILEEGNRWRDTYWGIDIHTGEGENHLGKILMQVREELRNDNLRGPQRRSNREASNRP
jgi:ribA/ribD-fused uncharacterized protein